MTTGLLPYSKDEKSRPTKHHNRRQSRSFHVTVSIVCALIGVASVAFAVSVILQPPRIVTVFRCGRAEDTLRTFRSKKVSVSKGGGAGVGEGDIVARPKLLGFVGIQTGFDSADRRRALRSTWFPSNPDALLGLEQATGLAFRFVIGKTKNADKMGELKIEEEMYHDFLFVDHEEQYVGLQLKTLAFFKAAYDLFEADFYVKMDDDIYLRPDRLATLLAKERPHPFTYIGCMKKGPVIKDPSLKWYEGQSHLLGSEYFSHAYGPVYALSMEVVSALANAKTESLRMFTNEDVTVGAWILAMNVTYEDNIALCHSKCTLTSIAVWDIPKCSGLCNPVTKLNELHNDLMCSQSPTMPPEEKFEDID